ncbi:MAG: nucleotidyl transferase AbiEii/AbiGii toxin family protein [Candidatus Omnitrophica bacterium]|nr:nucleotidyl transferase AbiEii/AbiGii toxin family protein [Candidatus Omnitrophota bacterium]
MTKKVFDAEVHKRILVQILLDVSKNFPGKMGFKGGTCAQLFYNLPRISVDLDFDILSPFTPAEIDELKIFLGKYGAIKNFHDKRHTTFFLLDYRSNFPNVKIELNKRIWKNNVYLPVWLLGVEIKIADEETIFTNKLVALTDRKLPVARDLFDSYYFFKAGYSVKESLLQERTGKNTKEYLLFLKKYIKRNFNKRIVLQGLGEILEEAQKEWVRKNLVDEAIKEIDKYLTEEDRKKEEND